MAVGAATTWQSVVAGGSHSCGLLDGQLHCWGNNMFGQLGIGFKWTPMPVVF